MKLLKNNKGSGFAVIIYGVTVMLLFIFTAINILNAKVIENGYNSLRDAVFSASSGSVIHLLTTQTGGTDKQNEIIGGGTGSPSGLPAYDVYLQLALGYIINRNTSLSSSTSVKSGEVNNFIKLDHKKVVNSTMALLDDSIIRNKANSGNLLSVYNNTDKFKIFMIFIEPYYTNTDYEKFFDIIVYGSGDFDEYGNLKTDAGRTYAAGGSGSLTVIFENIQSTINNIIKDGGYGVGIYNTGKSFKVNLNPDGFGNVEGLVRKMETMPYYLIVVKDFALPTLFDNVETNTGAEIFKNPFKALSGDGTLSSPMCALNSGKTERKTAGIR